jgi:dTMP kinase
VTSRLITIEGGEGSGKSTLIEALAKVLPDVVVTREPGGCELAEQIRTLLLSHSGTPIDTEAETLLFLAARAQHIHEIIRPALQSGKTVLCDRFNDSTAAYQGYARGLGLDYVERLCNLAFHDLQPDITLLLDIDPALGLRRAGRVSGPDRMESETLDFHTRVNEGFRKIARRHSTRVHVLDARLPPDQIAEQALQWIT